MSTHNIHVHDEIRKFATDIPKCLLSLAIEECPKDSNRSSTQSHLTSHCILTVYLSYDVEFSNDIT